MTDLHDALMSGAGPTGRTAKFPEIGHTHKGTIVGYTHRPDTTPDGQQRTFPDGTPRPPVMVVSLQTDAREDAEDDGLRSLWLTYQLKTAVIEAVQKSGGPFAVGGELAVKHTGTQPPKVKGHNPTKLFAAKYTPPAPSGVNEDDIF